MDAWVLIEPLYMPAFAKAYEWVRRKECLGRIQRRLFHEGPTKAAYAIPHFYKPLNRLVCLPDAKKFELLAGRANFVSFLTFANRYLLNSCICY